jgi:hypothetical protein
MTLHRDLDTIPTGQPEREGPVDPRPAWERVAYTWLAREVDAGQPVDPTALAREVSVAPMFARDLVRVLRGHRDRDPALSELRARLVRDRIAEAYLRWELAGGGRLDLAELAAEVGTTPAVARQWLGGLRARQTIGHGLQILAEPVSHGRPSPAQLAGLQAHFAGGGYQQASVTGRPIDPERLAAEVERHYWMREVHGHERLRPTQLARELGGDQRQVSQQLATLRAGPATAAERIAQLWHQQEPGGRPLRSSQLAWRLGVSDSYVRHVTWQLRTRAGPPLLAERLAATTGPSWWWGAGLAAGGRLRRGGPRAVLPRTRAGPPGCGGQGRLRRLWGAGAVPGGGPARPPGPPGPRRDLRRHHRQ